MKIKVLADNDRLLRAFTVPNSQFEPVETTAEELEKHIQASMEARASYLAYVQGKAKP